MGDAIKWNFRFSAEMGHLDDKNVDFKHVVLSLNWQKVDIHYHQKCQDISDHAGDNKPLLIQKIEMVVLATEIGHRNVKWWDFKYGVLSLDSQMVNIHYHLKCQDITDNAGDNKPLLIQKIQMVVIATEIGHLHFKWWEFKYGVLSLDSQMVNIHYHLKCQDIADNAGDNKPLLIQKVKMVVFATEIGHLHFKWWDFKYGVLSLDSQIVNIHYHLKCQDITDNVGDNKRWLLQWIQNVVFATEIGKNLDDKRLDFMHGFLSFDSQMVYVNCQLKCQGIRENAGDNKLWLFRSIQMVIFTTEIGHLDDKGWDFEHRVLFLDLQVVNIHYHLMCQDNIESAGDNKLSQIQ